MSVQYIKGDAISFPEGTNVLLHGVNQLGVMGAGFALQVRERYPAAHEVYMAAYGAEHLWLGTFTVATLEDGRKVVNLVTQREIGTEKRQVDYEALYAGLESIHALLLKAFDEGRVYSIAMPWIGCGLAGGNRRVVEAMVESIFGSSDIMVYVVDYKPIQLALTA